MPSKPGVALVTLLFLSSQYARAAPTCFAKLLACSTCLPAHTNLRGNEIVAGLPDPAPVRCVLDTKRYLQQLEHCSSSFCSVHIYDDSGSLRRTLFFSPQSLQQLGRHLTWLENGTGSGLVWESKKSFGIPMRDPRPKRDNRIACERVCHEFSSAF